MLKPANACKDLHFYKSWTDIKPFLHIWKEVTDVNSFYTQSNYPNCLSESNDYGGAVRTGLTSESLFEE